MKIRPLLIIFFLLFFQTFCWAYTPPYWMILSRWADTHGKGFYSIDVDVLFSENNETLVVNEKWTIGDDGRMRLEVSGKGPLKDKISLNFFYDDQKRHFIDEKGVVKAQRVPADFFEPLFHFRDSRAFRGRIVAAKLAPAETLRSEPHKYSPQNPYPAVENFIQLTRLDGVVTYAIGQPTTLWIEQDQFVLRQALWPSQVRVKALRYETFAQGLQFPREREVHSNDRLVRLITNNVQPLPASAENKSRLSPARLNELKETPMLWSEHSFIRQFYSQFR